MDRNNHENLKNSSGSILALIFPSHSKSNDTISGETAAAPERDDSVRIRKQVVKQQKRQSEKEENNEKKENGDLDKIDGANEKLNARRVSNHFFHSDSGTKIVSNDKEAVQKMIRDRSSLPKATEVETDELITLYHFTDKDVLMGRGNHVNKLAGNLRFRRIVHPFRTAYNNTKDSMEKRRILNEAYHSIIDGGANRFLEIVHWGPPRDLDQPADKGSSNESSLPSRSAPSAAQQGVFRTVVLSRALEKVAQALREPKWVPPPPEKDDSAKSSTLHSSKDDNAKSSPLHSTTATESDDVRNKRKDKEKTSVPVLQIKHVLLLTPKDGESMDHQPKRDTEDSVVEQQIEMEPSSSKAKNVKRLPLSTNGSKKASREPKRRRVLDEPSSDYKDKLVGLAQLGEIDVMFGRGHYVNKHSGNVHFRKVILEHKAAYAKLPPSGKRPMALEIFKKFEGRFWEATHGTSPMSSTPSFRRVALDRCLEKICQALREKYTYTGKTNQWSYNQNSNVENTGTKTKTVTFEQGGKSVPSQNHTIEKKIENKSLVLNTDNINHISLGSMISIYWPIDDTYYEAVVEDSRVTTSDSSRDSSPSTGEDLVLYNIRYLLDNEREWIDLRQHKYKVLGHCTEPAQNQVDPDQQQRAGEIVPLIRRGSTKRRSARRTFFWQREGETNPRP